MTTPVWQRRENLRHDYVPPVVAQGVVTAEQFWDMARSNSRLRGDAARLVRHAEQMLAQSRPS